MPLSTSLTAGSSLVPFIYSYISKIDRRFIHLTDTNESPSFSEEHEIRKALAIAKDYLSWARTNLKKLRLAREHPPKRSRAAYRPCDLVAALIRAQQVEDVILVFIRRHKKVLSVVRRVPSEIWAEVFSHLSTSLDPCYIDLSSMPWVLGRVCSHWRALAIETPAVWTNLYLNLEMYGLSVPESQRRRERLETIVQRSKAVPRELHLESAEDAVDQSTLDYACGLLLRNEGMISSIRLEMPIAHFQLIREHLTPSRLSSLEELTIDFPLYFPQNTPRLQDFAIAPRLKSVEIVTGTDFSSQILLPLRQLEDVVLHEASSEDVLLTVLGCPKMTRLDVQDLIEFKPPVDPTNLVRHENLRTVILGDVLMLNHLDLPSIVKLGVGSYSEPVSFVQPQAVQTDPSAEPEPPVESTAEMDALYHFLKRSGQGLESLDMACIPMKTLGLLPILELVPHLRSLSVTIEEATSMEDDIIRSVILSLEGTGSETRPPFLPSLESCQFHFHQEKFELTIVDHCLVRMLRSRFKRTNLSVPFKRFRLYAQKADIFCNISDSDTKKLKDMVKHERLDIEIGYNSKSSL